MEGGDAAGEAPVAAGVGKLGFVDEAGLGEAVGEAVADEVGATATDEDVVELTGRAPALGHFGGDGFGHLIQDPVDFAADFDAVAAKMPAHFVLVTGFSIVKAQGK